jgi:hypothetical protein
MGGTLLRKLSETSLIVETKLIFWNHPYSHLESKCIFRNKKPRYWADIYPSGYETDLNPQIQTPLIINKDPIRL